MVRAIADDLAGTDSRYPDRVAFIDVDEPRAGREIVAAFDDDYAVVLVSDDGRERVLTGRSLDAGSTDLAVRPGHQDQAR